MPVITVNLLDFSQLLGRKITIKELQDRLPMMGTGWEGETEEGFNIEVFPNRPDLLSIEGLARAYASFSGEKIGLRNYAVLNSGYIAIVDDKVEKVRPYFVGAIVKGVDFDDALIRSIIQLQEKLHVTHGRKRRKVAIGLHNLKPIEFPITYTTKPPEYKFRPLGERFEKDLKWMLTEMPKGVEYAWILHDAAEYPIILDAKGMVLSMPPIINGEYTRIDEATRDLFIDVTGTDLKAITEVLNIICTTFADRGASVYNIELRYLDKTLRTPDLSPKIWRLSNKYVSQTLGLELQPKETIHYLEKMGHSAQGGEIMHVKVPCYRTDVMHPIDLVEDVAIAYGYDLVVPIIPSLNSPAGEDPLEVFSRNLRNFLVGFGYTEIVTFMMSNREKLFTKMLIQEESIAETDNPKMEAYNCLRNRLLPSLMEILVNNKHHPYPQNLYEVDDVIIVDPSTEIGARSERRLAIVQCHSKANFSEIKAALESILDNLELKIEYEANGWDCFIEGRRLTGKINGVPLCWAGEIRPEALESWGLEMPVAALELNVEGLHKIFS
ncbi:phenylalanine--tRNA ligase subunit beta [Candidatus Bathyarchaeota archaeon]|nr:phenylalanine--tRNA ligase subunit beta [Candidatus Bathyarchaeota archaeon]